MEKNLCDGRARSVYVRGGDIIVSHSTLQDR